MDNKPQKLELPFRKIEQVAKDTYSFYFLTQSTGFTFLPGQYMRMILPHENADERGTSRYFSISSSPSKTDFITITTRIIRSSFKKALFNLTPGLTVQFFGPNGNFVLDEQDSTPHVFLAGGIGITPFHSMITYIAEKKLTIPVTLFVSFSTQAEIAFYDELSKIASEHTNIKIVYTITQSEGSNWSGEAGRISEDLIKKYVSDFQKPRYMIAGPPAMVKAMEEMVLAMGIDPTQLKKENFVGY